MRSAYVRALSSRTFFSLLGLYINNAYYRRAMLTLFNIFVDFVNTMFDFLEIFINEL
ncbi:hypothetical protein GCM10022628_08280 [Anoxybacillus suryakundensis]